MIVWFNCKISDIRPNPQPRFNLRNDNRFDIARYSFASFAPLTPLVTKFVFNLEMADGHAGEEAAMESWLRGIFPEDKLSIEWFRCNNLEQWRIKQAELHSYNDPIIFPAGNEDHIFIGSDTTVMAAGLDILRQSGPDAVIMTSHYPESIRAAYALGGSKFSQHYAQYSMANNDAIRIMRMELFDWYLDQIKDPNKFFFRTEHWNDVAIPQNTILVPLKEQFRHFDGYAHVKVGPEVCPPMEIPHGFFTGMKVRYGFQDCEPNSININPRAQHFRAVDDAQGVDFKCLLEDMPAFWNGRIAELLVSPDIDHHACSQARDQYLIDLTRIDIDWFHIGKKFDRSNWPPVSWIQQYLKHQQNDVIIPQETKSFGSSLSSI